MSQRTIFWLAGGLIVLVLLAVVGQRRNAPAAPETNAVFLPGLMDNLDQVNEIAIAGAGSMPVATLERGGDGWTVREREGYPADLMKVRHTLLTFAEANILEAKTANPELFALLGVEDIDVPDASGHAVTLAGITPPITVIVGNEAGDYRRYVRRAGENQSYMINRDPEIGTTAAEWLDAAIIDLPSSRVRAVTVTHPGGEVVRISKANATQTNFTVENVPEGRTLLYDSVANVMAGVLQNLELEDVERDPGPAEDEIVTELTTFDGLRLTIRGRQRGDGHWIALAAEAVPGEPPAATAENAAPSEAPAETAEDASAEPGAVEPVEEAGSLNARLSGWRYRIPAYKFDQLTRSLDDLLQAQP